MLCLPNRIDFVSVAQARSKCPSLQSKTDMWVVPQKFKVRLPFPFRMLYFRCQWPGLLKRRPGLLELCAAICRGSHAHCHRPAGFRCGARGIRGLRGECAPPTLRQARRARR